MAIPADSLGTLAEPPQRSVRHAGIDRLFHWFTALTVLTLMATGLLPHLGMPFDWIEVHWIAGLALVALTVFHILRALFWQHFRTIWFGAAERNKYSVAQKLMHHAMALMVLAAVCTGLLMLKKISTPFLARDPYFLAMSTWGIVYVIHGLAALAAVTLVIIHIYFALIPENRRYLRAMVYGWMTRS